MKTIEVKRDGDEKYFDLYKLLEGYRISPRDVGYYELVKNEDNTLKLTLYNKNKKFINLSKYRVVKDNIISFSPSQYRQLEQAVHKKYGRKFKKRIMKKKIKTIINRVSGG